MGFCGDILKTLIEGSVDYVIYRDYIVKQRFFSYCSPACESSVDDGNTKTPSMHRSLGSATLSQLAFSGEK